MEDRHQLHHMEDPLVGLEGPMEVWEEVQEHLDQDLLVVLDLALMEVQLVVLDLALMEVQLVVLDVPHMEVQLEVLDLLPMELESEALEDPWEVSDPHPLVVLSVELDTHTMGEDLEALEDPLEPLDLHLMLVVLEDLDLHLMLEVLEDLDLLLMPVGLEVLELLPMELPLEALDQLHTYLLPSHPTEVTKSLHTIHPPTTNLAMAFNLVTTTVLPPLVTMRSTTLTALTATTTSTHPEASRQFPTMFHINKCESSYQE